MKLKYFYLKNAVFLVLALSFFSSILMAQKKPESVKLDVDADDMILCGGQVIVEGNSRKNPSQQQNSSKTDDTKDIDVQRNNFANGRLCVLFRAYYYNLNNGNLEGAMYNRNEMIDLVVGQVNTYFKLRKDGRRTKIRFYETILDFLRIGGEFAVTIMNGERVKTIIGAALGSLDTGRKIYDKNFEVLETQVLINNMKAKRLRKLTEITIAKDKPVRDKSSLKAYSWDQARNDLRDYLLAGTFDDALDDVVEQSSSNLEKAKKELEAAQKPASESNVSNAKGANKILVQLGKQLKGSPADKDSATKTLRDIVKKLQENTEITALLAKKGVIATSEGQAIWDALFQLRGEINAKTDLVDLINNTIIDADQ